MVSVHFNAQPIFWTQLNNSLLRRIWHSPSSSQGVAAGQTLSFPGVIFPTIKRGEAQTLKSAQLKEASKCGKSLHRMQHLPVKLSTNHPASIPASIPTSIPTRTMPGTSSKIHHHLHPHLSHPSKPSDHSPRTFWRTFYLTNTPIPSITLPIKYTLCIPSWDPLHHPQPWSSPHKVY